MALSDKLLSEAWNRVERDLKLSANAESYLYRVSDANEQLRMIVGLFYDLMAPFYERRVTLVPSSVGAYFVSTGSWVAATRRLTATMNRVFASTDVGCDISFVIGSSIYHGYVETFVSTTVVQINGDNLPSNNGTVIAAILAKTSVTNSVASLSSVDMMRTGQYIRTKLKSSLMTTDSAVRTKPATIEEIDTFRASGQKDKSAILFGISGNNLYLTGGTRVSTNLGTLTLTYPGMPEALVDDNSELDIPAGTPYELFIMQWEKIVRVRERVPMPNLEQEIEVHIKQLYNTFQGELSAESLKTKASKLK